MVIQDIPENQGILVIPELLEFQVDQVGLVIQDIVAPQENQDTLDIQVMMVVPAHLGIAAIQAILDAQDSVGTLGTPEPALLVIRAIPAIQEPLEQPAPQADQDTRDILVTMVVLDTQVILDIQENQDSRGIQVLME